MLLPADYPNSQNFVLHYADMVDSTSLTNLLKCVRGWGLCASFASVLLVWCWRLLAGWEHQGFIDYVQWREMEGQQALFAAGMLTVFFVFLQDHTA